MPPMESTPEQRKFLESVQDSLKKAAGRGKAPIVFVRCVDDGVQENAASAVEAAFGKIQWAHLNLRENASWDVLKAEGERTTAEPHGLLLFNLPEKSPGTPDPRAVLEILRYHRVLKRRGNVAIFVLMPPEVQAIMDGAPDLWTQRAGYFAWPQRVRPLSEFGLYGEREGEAADEDEDAPAAPAAARPAAAPREPATEGGKRRNLGGSPLEAADASEVLLTAATLFQSGVIEHAGAYAVRALTSFHATHDHHGAGDAQHLLAMIAEKRADVASAIGWYEKALEAYTRTDKTELEQAMVLERLGHAHFGRGQVDVALTYFRRALEKDEARADEPRMAAGYRHLALALEKVERLALAESFLKRALDIDQALGNKQAVARCYLHLGRIGYRLGRFTEATDQLRAAQGICEDLGDQSGLSAVLHELGNVDLGQGLLPEAISWYKKALEVDDRLGSRQAVARGHAQLGHAYAELGRVEESLRHLLTAHQSVSLLGAALAKEVLDKIRALRESMDKDTYQKLVDELAATQASNAADKAKANGKTPNGKG